MLTITDANYASMICNQFNFQASEATLKVTGLCPLNTIITGSTNTLDTALANLPGPTVCNYLFCSNKTKTALFHPAYLLYFSCLFTSYTTNLITSLFSTLTLLYPTLQITDVWETPSNHPTKETITEVLAKSNLHLQSVRTFNPYDASHICPTSIPDSDLPPQHKTKSRKHPGHNNPPPRLTASISPQLLSSWTQGSPPYPTQQPANCVLTFNNRNSSYIHHHLNAQQPPSPGCCKFSLRQPSPNPTPRSQPPRNYCSAQ